MPDPRSGTARGVYNGYFYMVGGASAGGARYHNMIRRPIRQLSSNCSEWETIPLTFRNGEGYICHPNCAAIFEDRNVMYTIGRYMNWGNGDNWDSLYTSYKYDFATSTLTEMNWDSTDLFTKVTYASVVTNNIDTIYVIGGRNQTASPQGIVQIYNIIAGIWQTKQIDFYTQYNGCAYYNDKIYIFPDGGFNLYYVRKLDVSNINVQTILPYDIVVDIRVYFPENKGLTGTFGIYSPIDHKIYFGAGDGETGRHNDVYTIDVIDDTFEYLSDAVSHLDVGVSHPGVMMIGATMKLFGGIGPTGGVDIIQYAAIAPVAVPTSAPTVYSVSSSVLEFHIDPDCKMPDVRTGTARGVYNGYFYMIGGASAGGKRYHNMIRTPIHQPSSNCTEWETIPLTFRNTEGYLCHPNCAAIFEDRNVMYTIGRNMNWGNGDNWDSLYTSYKYDFVTSTLTEMNWDSSDLFTKVTYASVVTNNIDTIYVIGGLNQTASPQGIVQIYNIIAGIWQPKQIDFYTQYSGCAYYNDKIYIFPDGGLNLYYVRKLDVSNINVQTILPYDIVADIRVYFPDNNGLMGTFGIYSPIDHKIYFGAGSDATTRYNDVYTIDVIDDTFQYLSNSKTHLDIGVSHPGAILADATIKLFGGIAQTGGVNIIQYATIPTAAPTSSPSTPPSATPSGMPSGSPSSSPSANPSFSPTPNPSVTPSSEPSVSPSWDPSIPPSLYPSVSPSFNPSVAPTSDPSVSPTSYPSVPPTSDPSVSPSEEPSVSPTSYPSVSPSLNPSVSPSSYPSSSPSVDPSSSPHDAPTTAPTTMTDSPSLAPSQRGWIMREKAKFNCNDGYQKAEDPNYCEPCGDGYVGTSGQCDVKCGSAYEPNDKRDECVSLAIIDEVIVVITIVPVLIACLAAIYAKRKSLNVSVVHKYTQMIKARANSPEKTRTQSVATQSEIKRPQLEGEGDTKETEYV